MKIPKILKIFNILIFLFTFITIFSSDAKALESDSIDRMSPLPSERLDPEISIPECYGVTLIEWRPTPNKIKTTSPNKTSLSIISQICSDVFKNYFLFLKQEGFKSFKSKINYDYKIKLALMPADIDDYGSDFRNLNDVNHRFRYRKIKDTKYVWGYFDTFSKTIFMQNDPVNIYWDENLEFKITLAHELYHSISIYTGIYYKVGIDKEEEMAENFVKYIGY